ncbi:MAG: hypothetical protein IV090_09465 [Candidatus Sericytochromatia bacterium]|nr:hypothetical protein [Candidatus Sericytochromatia bacterium]
MGGNAISNTLRLKRSEYESYEQELITLLGDFLKTPFAPLQFYSDKASFGDIDFVVAQPKPDRGDLALFFQQIGSREQYFNGDMLSFEYKNFQVDLNFVAPENYETALFYFAYNDLNNLIGRIAHKFGLKFGFDGLCYQIRTESGYRAKKITLSKDPAAIYTFLGYDYSRFLQGFKDREAIFEFVASSRYFNSAIFELDELNHINRTRNKKRQTYQLFLQWLTGKTFNEFRFEEDKSIYLIRIHNHFYAPNSPSQGGSAKVSGGVDLLGELATYAEEHRKHEFAKALFNGGQLMKTYGLSGSALGKVMADFKQDFCAACGQADFEQAVFEIYATAPSPEAAMAERFKQWYQQASNQA